MQKLCTWIVLMLLSTAVLGQTLSFSQTYAPLKSVTSQWTQVVPGGSGFYAFQQSSTQITLAYYDEVGNRLSMRTITSPQGFEPGFALIRSTAGGNLWLAFDAATNKSRDVFLMRLDSSLQTIGEYRQDLPSSDFLSGLYVPAGSEDVIALSRASDSMGNFTIMTTRVGPTGVIRYNNTATKIGDAALFDAVEVPGGNTYVVGRHNTATLIRRLDSDNGSLLSEEAFPPTGTYYYIRRHPTTGDLYVWAQQDSGSFYIRRLNQTLGLLHASAVFPANLYNVGINSFGNIVTVANYGTAGQDRVFSSSQDLSSHAIFFMSDLRVGSSEAKDGSYLAFVRPTVVSAGVADVGQVYSWTGATTISVGPVETIADPSWNPGSVETLLDGSHVYGGSTIIAGQTYSALLSYTATGTLRFRDLTTVQGHGRRTVIETKNDSANNRYVLTNLDNTAQITKFSATGAVMWDAIVSNTSPKGISIGPDGNPVVVCSNQTTGDSNVIKVSSASGVTVWNRELIELPKSNFVKIATALDGSIAIAGSLERSPSFGFDGVVAKLSGGGSLLWHRFAHLGAGSDAWTDLVIPNSQYLVVAGFGLDVAGSKIRMTVYDPSGKTHWDQVFPVVSGSTAQLALQSSGLVGLVSRHSVAGNYQLQVRRFDPVRKQTFFSTVLNGTNNLILFDAAMSPAGTLYVGQSSTASKGLIQYGSNGNVAWVRTLPSGVTKIQQVVTDAQNSVYVLAEESYADAEGGTTLGMIWLKYNTLGTLVTQQRIRGQGAGQNADPTDIHIGTNFDVWLSGVIRAPETGNQISINRYLQPVAPTVAGESYTVAPGQTLTVTAPGVLANDSDLNGDTFSATIVSNPSAGSLTLNANGSFTYVAPATMGNRTFTYRVTDSTGRSANGVATILVQ